MSLFQKKYVVTEEMTAKVMGSGDLDVLATPALVACVENTCKKFAAANLTPNKTTVGSLIELKHLRPSKVGATFTVAIIGFEEDRKMYFTFEVFEGDKKIAEGKHSRAVVEINQFLSQL